MSKKVVKKIWGAKEIKWFTDTTNKWIERYMLHDWIVIMDFSEKTYREIMPNDLTELLGTTEATTCADPTYHKARITYYPELLKRGDEKWTGKYVENCIKHEVCHLLTEKISLLAADRYATKQQIDDEIEILTQKISIIT